MTRSVRTHDHRSLPARLLQILLAAVLLVALASCGDDDGAAAAPRHDDVASLAEELDGVDGGCDLEYEGLTDAQREVSVCTIGGDIAELSVWTDPEAHDAAVSAARERDQPLVTGPNWTISVGDRELAQEIADATGGELVG